MRNIRKGGVIDIRDFLLSETRETTNSFVVTVHVSQKQMKNQKLTMRTKASDRASEARRTFWTRLLAGLNLPLGARREVEIKGLSGEHIAVHHWAEGLPAFEFNGLFDVFDIAAYDTVVLEFFVDSGKITSVDVSVEEAKDKALTRELEELLAQARVDFDEEQGWSNIEWLLRRCFEVTRVQAETNGGAACTFDIAPKETFYDTHVFVQWSWPAPDEVEIEFISAEHAFPKLTQGALMGLQMLGWDEPHKGRDLDCPNFSQVLREPKTDEVVALISETLRLYQAKSTDWVVVRPQSVSKRVIDIPAETEHQKWCYPQGLMNPDDVKLLRAEQAHKETSDAES